MKCLRMPLYAKILLMLFANLIFVGLLFLTFIKVQLNFGLESLLTGRMGERVKVVTSLIATDLQSSPREEWDEILERFAESYEVGLYLFRDRHYQYAGPEIDLPEAVAEKLGSSRRRPRLGPPPENDRVRQAARRPRPDDPDGGSVSPPENDDRVDGEVEDAGPPWLRLRDSDSERERVRGRDRDRDDEWDDRREEEFRRRMMERIPPSTPLFLLREKGDGPYWVGTRLRVASTEFRHPFTVNLLMRTDSLVGNSLFLDIVPWVAVAVGVLLLCILFWWPFVHGITRYLRQMSVATEAIAKGSFTVHVSEKRNDELGRLGMAINKMAKRLEGYVSGQKRFMGDIAHELCSPVARMRMALGVLEQRASKEQERYVEDVSEEVAHMSEMVDELLAFSKASLKPMSVRLEPVLVAPVVERVLKREGGDSASIKLEIPEGLRVLADEGLLFRALANVIRNAIFYAGGAGPITISGESVGDVVKLSVADCGPGAPPQSVDKLFDPFYRAEASRSPETGGTGLGLAIVKTCVESCQGRVACRNRKPQGFVVELELKAPA